MSFRLAYSALLLAGLLGLTGCNLPGKPTTAEIVPRPTDVLDPVVLYKQNCAGCHGADGKLGPAPPIGDPVYLALVDDDTLRTTITKGRTGTAMSAFGESAGGESVELLMTSPVTLTEIMPAQVRTTGFSLAYSLATTLGGSSLAISQWLIHITGDKAAPGLWLSFAALCGLLATWLVFRDPSRRDSHRT